MKYIQVQYDTDMGEFTAGFQYCSGDSDDRSADMEIQWVRFNGAPVTEVMDEVALGLLFDLAYDEVY